MIIKLLVFVFMMISPFSGFTDERFSHIFTPAEGKTYIENVVQLFAERPEAARYILEYPLYYGGDIAFDLTNEVTQGEIPLFLQWDRRWGYKQYGSNLLAMTGCGPTCLSMVYSGLTGDTAWNPYEVARFSEESGYYVPGVGTSWDLLTSGADYLGLTVQYVSMDAGSIEQMLQSGSVIICSMRPGDFTSAGHFIVLTGTDGAGNISVRDPNSKWKSDTTWRIERLMPQIKGIWAYRYDGISKN